MKLSYNDSEVRKFHPQVKSAICKYMKSNNLDTRYRLLHHINESGVSGIPDFVLVNKKDEWVFVIEVKRTPASTKSPETWNQGKKYADIKNPYWEKDSPLYFVTTNIETTCFLENTPKITPATITTAKVSPGIMNLENVLGATNDDSIVIAEFSNDVRF